MEYPPRRSQAPPPAAVGKTREPVDRSAQIASIEEATRRRARELQRGADVVIRATLSSRLLPELKEPQMSNGILALSAALLIGASTQFAFADETGTVGGAVGGAVVGGAVGGPVGAVVGGIGGAAVGNSMTNHRYYHHYYGYHPYHHHHYYYEQ
jgi:hypothetical protein